MPQNFLGLFGRNFVGFRGGEVVFGKAGKETYGLGRFFSSVQNRSIPGLSFLMVNFNIGEGIVK